MRRFVFLFIILSGAVSFAVACSKSDDVPKTETKIYYADARLMRLLPYSAEIIDADTEHMAKAALEVLIQGRDENDNIRRIIPEKDDCLSVYVKDNIAYVDIDSKIKESLNYNRDIEKLFIYQIVNTLTSVKGIRFVKFTVDGDIHKDFLGFYDMRKTYKFTYPE